MRLPYEIKLAWRFSRQGKKLRGAGRFVSFISAMSTASIALGVMALIVVLSVMNGFQKEVRDRMLAVIPHIEVVAALDTEVGIENLEEKILANNDVLAAAPYVTGQALLSTNERVKGVLLKGIDPEKERGVSDIANHMKDGALEDLNTVPFGIVLGRDLALSMRVKVGSPINVLIPQGRLTPAGVIPRVKTFKVVGIFSSEHYEFDSSMALISLSAAKTFFQVTQPTGLRLKVADMHRAPVIARELMRDLPEHIYARDWSAQNRTWFAAVQVEKRMMGIILFLIVLVGAFGLVSSMVMTVTQKQSDIAILRTLGATPSSVLTVFMLQGAIVGTVGVAIGVAAGVAISLNITEIVSFVESLFGVEFLPRQIYFIDSMPSDLQMGDVIPIALFSFLTALLATVYPSIKAAKTHPAEALRYE
ncbi:MAG TPA: lipoprotein-releasing ABC transporter permease subunit [Sutterella sp.]|nr:lipoprotein-releasing ABC transporter permease subunit [Sutterella sp.]